MTQHWKEMTIPCSHTLRGSTKRRGERENFAKYYENRHKLLSFVSVVLCIRICGQCSTRGFLSDGR